MKLLDKKDGSYATAQLAEKAIALHLQIGNMDMGNFVLDVGAMPHLVLVEGTPEEILAWRLAGGEIAEGLKHPLMPSIGRLPELAEKLMKLYRQTDPEDYSERVDLIKVLCS
ncbi:MAG: hypothetical protein KatS3mg023_3939 [Armatimonadota bacterium]|jgi:hypothetical protein|nr:MAG: hypothetical protein KatS3mg023_3760 [Armatimonadota bacterium]GIV22188.1 MAG: hypothetical protein KatS3mg023_3939 [Armatimonadota bacterium]